MPTPLEDHGGAVPSEFHTVSLPDILNRVILLVNVESSSLNLAFYKTLLLNHTAKILFNIPSPENALKTNIHPLISFCSYKDINEYATNIVRTNNMNGAFFYELSDKLLVHPEFWPILKAAKENTNYLFYDSDGKEHKLSYFTKEGVASKTVDTCRVAAYTCINDNIIKSVENGIIRHAKQNLSQIIIDTTELFTPLCYLATKYMTDKSPFNVMTHRHPYTAVYDTFLATYKYKADLKFGEIGILNGASIRMWRDYFPHANIHGFDIVESCVQKIEGIAGVTGHLVDASKGLGPVLQNECIGGKKFDILLEDASHMLDHQLLFIADAIEYVNPGGLLIIEDIFREIPATRFEEALSLVSHKVSKALLVQPEHKFRFSPGWENDRILFVWVS